MDLHAALAIEAAAVPRIDLRLRVCSRVYSCCHFFSVDAFEPVLEILAGAVQRLEVSSSGSQ
jgi:hypothetical protein